jgi:hypothetical protein
MTGTPFIYRSPLVYRLLMRGLYGRHYDDRYTAVAGEVPAGSAVLDVCAGDCLIYSRHLAKTGVHYRALDASPHFVTYARSRGIEAQVCDLLRDELPVADVVLIQGRLCQCMAEAGAVLSKLRRAARVKLVVAEPVRNLSDMPVVGPVARWLTRMRPSEHHDGAPARFNVESLSRLFSATEGFERSYPIPGGREVVGIFRGGAA